MAELRYDGRVAIVTGAGRGIGREHARLLAARGASVVVADLGAEIAGHGASTQPADDVVTEIEDAGGSAVACYGSVAEEADAAAMIQTAFDAFGRLDVVVNNAGIHDPGDFTDLPPAQFEKMLRVHFFGTLYTIKAAWPHFVDAGYGRIVNTCSEAMVGGVAHSTSYAAAKAAVFGLTKSLAPEGAEHGIKVNAIAPRANTRMSQGHSLAIADDDPPEVKERKLQIRELLNPQFCAPAVAFLAHESCPLTGEVLVMGMHMVARLAAVRSQGLQKEGLSPEDIAEHLDAIMDVSGGTVTDPLNPTA